MHKHVVFKIILLSLLIMVTFFTISNDKAETLIKKNNVDLELIYNNVWATMYSSCNSQCDNTPNITGDGSHINLKKASKYRWIAISQEMLNSISRLNLLDDPKHCKLYKGKISYGDTIWIISKYPKINGWWVVHDAKNSRYVRSIDFLQSKGDTSLSMPINGKWDGIKIYKLKNISYLNAKKYFNSLLQD
jgi:hypothetical protein